MLKPRKAKSLIPSVAEELGIPEDTVATITTYYWREVRKQLSSLSHNRVHITNLGDFTIKHWKIDERIELLQRREEKNASRGMQHMTALFKTAESLYELNHVKKMLEEERQRQEFVKLHKRTGYEQSGERNKDLEG